MNLKDGRKVTPEKEQVTALSAKSEIVKNLDIEALRSNSQLVTVGTKGSKVKSSERQGITLAGGDTQTIEGPVDLSTVFISSEVKEEGVAWTAEQS